MSDVSPSLPPPTPPKNPLLRRLQIALAISVALNLLVAGLVAGAALGRDKWADRSAIPRELGFGPFSGALGKPERDSLRGYLQERAPQLRAANSQRGREIAAVQAALRAQPFDAAALQTALSAMQQRQEGQLQLGYQAISQMLLAMPDDQRRAFADRLANGGRMDGGRLQEGPRKDGGN